MSKPNILFMGTPGFAVPSLEILIKHDYPIIAVVTQPDRPKGRGRQYMAPPVKELAEKSGLAVIQPERVRNEDFLQYFRAAAPDLVVLVAFGQILPKEIIEGPPRGCINVHPSLLPKYRGAAPINWALIRGERKTGVTIMQMDEGVDSGDILLQEETDIGPDENYAMLHDRLAKQGASLLFKAVMAIEHGESQRRPQDQSAATFAPRIKQEDTVIRWDSRGADIVNFIRGLAPVPCAVTALDGRQMKVFSASFDSGTAPGVEPGTLGKPDRRGLPVAAADGWVYLGDIQMENKKRMPVQDFLRGYRIASGKLGQQKVAAGRESK